jgi:TnpA family transposase
MPRFGGVRSKTPGASRNRSFARTTGQAAPEETAVPVGFLSDAERERLDRFPAQVVPGDIETYFTLSRADRRQIPRTAPPANRLGFALQLGALRFLGFCPDDLGTAPEAVVAFVARQLDVAPGELTRYGRRGQTRTEHLRQIRRYLGFRKATAGDLARLETWLVDRALEHDRPTLLLRLACEHLLGLRVERPGVTHLERLIAAARQRAQQETYRRLAPVLTGDCKARLDGLLTIDAATGRSRLAWLQQSVASSTPPMVLVTLEKRALCRRWGVDRWDVSSLSPNRLKFLAQIARRSTNQALQRMPERRRYPILVAFLYQTLIDLTDEALDLFDRCLADAYHRARRDLEDFRLSVAASTNEKVRLFREIGLVVLDPEVRDADLRRAIYRRIPPAELRDAVAESDRIIRPPDDHYFDFLESRYTYLRQFTPEFLDALAFRSTGDSPLLRAVDLLRRLNAERRRVLPDGTSLDFVPARWRPYVNDNPDPTARRHYFELCVLWELRGALRAGDVWLEGSRRYADPETYLIPREAWPRLRAEVCREIQAPEDGTGRLRERDEELSGLLDRVEALLAKGGDVRMEGGDLVVSPLGPEEKPESTAELERLIDERLPLVELCELLIEVDGWTRFSDDFEHAGGTEPRGRELRSHLYAAILAQACNLGPVRMARISDLTYQKLAWCMNWYVRDETLKAATTRLVNFQYRQPLSRFWGTGTLSSSDGQRFPVSGKVRMATALPRYFGYGKGVTFYTWTADQFAQYGTKVIPATVRDATYVLDEILDNETELPILEHTTDTAGYTEIVFALFDLLGLQFSPRIRDLGDQRLFRMGRQKRHPHLAPLLRGQINRDRILRHWDDLLRVAGSLKRGWVTASLLIGKLQSYPRKNRLTRALQEHGRLVKTVFILRYLESADYRRRILGQLNKGEALHGLREFLLFANKGTLRKKQEEELRNQAGCLNLVTNAVVTWNTVYMAAVIERLRAEGKTVNEEDIARLSPARYEHINPYGKYRFEVEEGLSRTRLRPLRPPPEHPSR